MGVTKKTTIKGTQYLKVETDSGAECLFSLHNGDVVSPSTIKKPSDEDLYAACELVESEGYTVDLDAGLPPAGFVYP